MERIFRLSMWQGRNHQSWLPPQWRWRCCHTSDRDGWREGWVCAGSAGRWGFAGNIRLSPAANQSENSKGVAWAIEKAWLIREWSSTSKPHITTLICIINKCSTIKEKHRPFCITVLRNSCTTIIAMKCRAQKSQSSLSVIWLYNHYEVVFD